MPDCPLPRPARRVWGTAAAGFFIGMGMLAGCAGLPARPRSDLAQAVVRLAREQIGKPYRFGGQGPEGFDCSGLVRYVFREAAGVRLPRTAREQFRAVRPVPIGAEQPSDLVFFSTTRSGASHVGIYLGSGRFVHAPQTDGRVKVSDANHRYWRKRFVGVGRVLR